MVFSIRGTTRCRYIGIVRVLPRGYDPIVGELRRSDPRDSSIITRHATDYELLSFRTGGGTIHEKKEKKNKKERKKTAAYV